MFGGRLTVFTDALIRQTLFRCIHKGLVELAVSDSLESFATNSPPTFFGPSGAGTKFTTPSGESVPSGSQYQGRYAVIRATLSSTVAGVTPKLADVQLSFNTSSPVGSRVKRYAYDSAGNLTRITTQTDSGISTDVRRCVLELRGSEQ